MEKGKTTGRKSSYRLAFIAKRGYEKPRDMTQFEKAESWEKTDCDRIYYFKKDQIEQPNMSSLMSIDCLTMQFSNQAELVNHFFDGTSAFQQVTPVVLLFKTGSLRPIVLDIMYQNSFIQAIIAEKIQFDCQYHRPSKRDTIYPSGPVYLSYFETRVHPYIFDREVRNYVINSGYVGKKVTEALQRYNEKKPDIFSLRDKYLTSYRVLRGLELGLQSYERQYFEQLNQGSSLKEIYEEMGIHPEDFPLEYSIAQWRENPVCQPNLPELESEEKRIHF